MRYKATDHNLPYALNSNDELVSIYQIRNLGLTGLACNCRCPKCGEKLEARIGTGVRVPYFAHSKHSNCHGAAMTILHMLSEKIIEKHKAVMAPGHKSIKPRRLEFVDVEVEKREDRKDMQPDVVGITADGKRWAIEIYNTNAVDSIKRQKILSSGITCMEINVSKQSVSSLEDFLLNSISNRNWINNPNDEELLPEPTPEELAAQEKYGRERWNYYNSRKDEKYKSYLHEWCEGCPTPPQFGKCIYAQEVISFGGFTYTICNDEKRRKDLGYVPMPITNILNKKIDKSVISIPKSCSCLDDYYNYIHEKKMFTFKGQRHDIISVNYSSVCGQLLIIHKNMMGVSFYEATCLYIDNDGSLKEATIECSSDVIICIRKAKEKEWEEMEKNMEAADNFPF